MTKREIERQKAKLDKKTLDILAMLYALKSEMELFVNELSIARARATQRKP